MKKFITTLSLLLLIGTSLTVQAASEEQKKVNTILQKCQEKLKLGKLQGYQKCAYADIKELAEQGNYAAQYQLAEWADFEGNHDEALQWYQQANDNAATPYTVKTSHKARLQELQQMED